MIRPIELKDKGVARTGVGVYHAQKQVGYVTSGTMVPYWQTDGAGLSSSQSDDRKMRAIGLALMDSNLVEGDEIELDIRGKRVAAVIVPYFIRNEAPPYCWPIKNDQLREGKKSICTGEQLASAARALIEKAAVNTRWRQERCVNLIPSEQTASPMARLLSIMDPAGRYAEHKQVKAFKDADVFYYQGTDFICEVESLLTCELQNYRNAPRLKQE